MKTLNPHHKSAIALRKSQAHMYAAGFNDALRGCKDFQKVDELEFSRYFEELAIAYYSEAEVFMPSIPAAFETFSGHKIN